MAAATRCLLSWVDVERHAAVLDDRVAGAVEQREVELELAGEVLVEHRLGDARALGDVVHRRRVVALAHEHLERRLQQLDPTLATGEPPATGAGAVDVGDVVATRPTLLRRSG